MIDRNALATELREALSRRARHHSALKNLDVMTDACIEVLSHLTSKIPLITDPDSGLTLPPPKPEVLYKDRGAHPTLRGTTPDQFIELTMWAKYRDADLLSSTFIKELDISLYYAITGRASYLKVPVSQLMADMGIKSRQMIQKPTQAFARTANLLRSAERFARSARELGESDANVTSNHSQPER